MAAPPRAHRGGELAVLVAVSLEHGQVAARRDDVGLAVGEQEDGRQTLGRAALPERLQALARAAR
jgi:hypothetical protein